MAAIIVVFIVFMLGWLSFNWMYALAFKEALNQLASIPVEQRGTYVIRTDGIFPSIGERPPEHLRHRTKYGLIVYQDPKFGTCITETCRVLSEDELFN